MRWISLDRLQDDGWLTLIAVAAAFVLVAWLVHALLARVLRRVANGRPLLQHVLDAVLPVGAYLWPLIALQLVWQGADDKLPFIDKVRHLNGLLLVATLTWLAWSIVGGIAAGIVAKHPVNVADNLHARAILTQTRVLSRTVQSLVVLVGIALMVMTFPGARQIGTSLLASAGVVGLVAGLAARPAISNLIAGLQIALTQPIRIDDVLIVEGEWGRVEEITGAYVVLVIWDERRLIIPLQWFIEHPFQNWTRSASQLIGTVFLWVDYGMPLEPLRAEARRICESASEWDKRLCMMQVTDAGERALQLRFLVTSARADLNWDLRCKVREGLVALIQRDYPEHLPKLRTELQGAATATTQLPAQQSGPTTPSIPPVRVPA